MMTTRLKSVFLFTTLFLVCFFVACSNYKNTAVAPKAGVRAVPLDSLQSDYEDENMEAERKIFGEPDYSLTV